MDKISLKEFCKERDDYGKGQYKKYLSLTEEQEKKINSLNDNIGCYVKYQRGGKEIYMRVMAIGERNKIAEYYKGYLNEIRLDYIDQKLREWEGFWTWNIDKITVVKEGDEKLAKYLQLPKLMEDHFKGKIPGVHYGTSNWELAAKKYNKQLGLI